jgi:release factor glutamine methyltransferase
MRLDDWLRSAQSRLGDAGIESARLEAQMLAGHVLLEDRTWLFAHPDADFPDLAGESILYRRLAREPLAYILGWREFYGRRFTVKPEVLIPRQETETLIEAALEMDADGVRVLDLGTGSGCIGLTLALERPKWSVVCSDVSPTALEVARDNAELLKCRVEFVQADGCQDFPNGSFDLIVSNPPYVSRTEELATEIKDHEPELALYATGEGLDFYRRLSREARLPLRVDGTLVLELGAGQAASVRHIFEERDWKFVKIWKDLLGIDRVIAFRP